MDRSSKEELVSLVPCVGETKHNAIKRHNEELSKQSEKRDIQFHLVCTSVIFVSFRVLLQFHRAAPGSPAQAGAKNPFRTLIVEMNFESFSDQLFRRTCFPVVARGKTGHSFFIENNGTKAFRST